MPAISFCIFGKRFKSAQLPPRRVLHFIDPVLQVTGLLSPLAFVGDDRKLCGGGPNPLPQINALRSSRCITKVEEIAKSNVNEGDGSFRRPVSHKPIQHLGPDEQFGCLFERRLQSLLQIIRHRQA